MNLIEGRKPLPSRTHTYHPRLPEARSPAHPARPAYSTFGRGRIRISRGLGRPSRVSPARLGDPSSAGRPPRHLPAGRPPPAPASCWIFVSWIRSVLAEPAVRSSGVLRWGGSTGCAAKIADEVGAVTDQTGLVNHDIMSSIDNCFGWQLRGAAHTASTSGLRALPSPMHTRGTVTSLGHAPGCAGRARGVSGGAERGPVFRLDPRHAELGE
jgi:hypothetical protein